MSVTWAMAALWTLIGACIAAAAHLLTRKARP